MLVVSPKAIQPRQSSDSSLLWRGAFCVVGCFYCFHSYDIGRILLGIILNCTTSTTVSSLHLGQYNGKQTNTVFQNTLVRVLLPQTGQQIHRASFSELLILFSPQGYHHRSVSGIWLIVMMNVWLSLAEAGSFWK